MRVTINIERLVLESISVPYCQQPLLEAAIETELAHLFTVNGPGNVLKTGGAVHGIAAGKIHLSDEDDPNNLGHQIARAVYEGLNR